MTRQYGIDGARYAHKQPKPLTPGTITDERNYFLIGWVAPAVLWIILAIALTAFVKNLRELNALLWVMIVIAVAFVSVWTYFTVRFARFLGYRPSTTSLFAVVAALSGVLGVFVFELWAFMGAIAVFGWLLIHSITAKQELAGMAQTSGSTSVPSETATRTATSTSYHETSPARPATSAGFMHSPSLVVPEPTLASHSSERTPPDPSAVSTLQEPAHSVGQQGSTLDPTHQSPPAPLVPSDPLTHAMPTAQEALGHPPDAARFCISCGTANPPSALFCVRCGSVIPDIV